MLNRLLATRRKPSCVWVSHLLPCLLCRRHAQSRVPPCHRAETSRRGRNCDARSRTSEREREEERDSKKGMVHRSRQRSVSTLASKKKTWRREERNSTHACSRTKSRQLDCTQSHECPFLDQGGKQRALDGELRTLLRIPSERHTYGGAARVRHMTHKEDSLCMHERFARERADARIPAPKPRNKQRRAWGNGRMRAMAATAPSLICL